MILVSGPLLNAALAAIVPTGAALIGQQASQDARTRRTFFMPPNETVMAAGGLVDDHLHRHPRLRDTGAASAWPKRDQTMGHIRRWRDVPLMPGIVIATTVFLLQALLTQT